MFQWLRKLFTSIITRNAHGECYENPPFPTCHGRRRRRPITPPSIAHDKPRRSTVTTASPFFELPFELRRRIYIEAFGGRTIHMDLSFMPPDLPGKGHARLQYSNYAGYGALGVLNSDTIVRCNNAEPPAWRWWSCVCHRNPLASPALDLCRVGEAECNMYKGEKPLKCFIGVMGCLLSSRQALVLPFLRLSYLQIFHPPSYAPIASCS